MLAQEQWEVVRLPAIAEAFGATVVLIEDKASGTQLIQELVHEGLHAVTRYQPQADKIMRSRRCQGQRLSRQAIPGS